MKNILIFLLSVALISCEEEAKPSKEIGSLGQLTYTGAIAADGCGWQIKIDSTYYSPINLPEEFLIQDNFINSSFEVTSDLFSCGLAPTMIPVVKVKRLPDATTTTIYWNETQCADPWGNSGEPSDLVKVQEMINYLEGEGIEPYTIQVKELKTLVSFCEACICSSGRQFVLRVDKEDLEEAEKLKFTSSACFLEDPMNSIEWLSDLKKQIEMSASPAGTRITQYSYKSECVLLIDDCVGCSDGLQKVYSYDKELICEFGGIDGRNTCSDFSNEAIDPILIFSSVEGD
ncbi:MAG: hypothetical protein JXR03_10135 [Cyclobacteriaceae bacterium]